MKILLIAGGNPEEWPTLVIEDFACIVGIDRGALYAVKRQWPLTLAVGDFDSLTAAEYQTVKQQAKQIRTFPAEKDDTDTQLALFWVFQQFPTAQVTLIGATNGRLDHFLANLWLPLEPRFAPYIRQLTIKDRQNTLTYYPPGTYTLTKEPDMRYLAYCALTPVAQLTLEKSKYTLSETNFSMPTSLASNEFVGQTADFSFTKGILAVIQSKDK